MNRTAHNHKSFRGHPSARSPRVLALAAIVSVTVGGCAADMSRSTETVNITDPQVDVPVVILNAAALDAAPIWELEEAFRVDGESSSDAKLSYIRQIVFSGDSAIVVLESQLPTILIYDTTGAVVRRFGRKGGGPGEFTAPRALAVAGDTLYVLDNTTIHRLRIDGRYIDGFQIRNSVTVNGRGSVMGATNMLSHTPAGLIGYFHVPNLYRGRDERVERDTMLLQVIDRPSGTVRTILHVEQADSYRNGSVSTPPLFVTDPALAVSPTGELFITRPSGTSIDLFDSDGRHIRRITFQPERRRVSDADVDGLLAYRDSWSHAMEARMLAEAGADDAHPDPAEQFAKGRRFMRTIPHAEHFPVIGRTLSSDAGELLVERPDLSEGSEEGWGRSGPTVWDVIDADGRIKGRLEFPERYAPKAMGRRMIVGVQRDANDVPSVVAFRF